MSATQEQGPEMGGAAGQEVSSGSERPLRHIFNVTAVVVGGFLGAVAIVIDWYLGKLLT